jgi:hypothetical protein
VRDRASWRKGVVIKVEEHTRVVRFDDNGAELTFQVDQLEVRNTYTISEGVPIYSAFYMLTVSC